ncbi:MAG: hypothetical protein RL514_2770 [Verrucomicrobiota bacterium]|jgi:toxin ParE1/3/4
MHGEALRTPEARLDLCDIWEYIADDNVSAADRLVEEIDAQCKFLARMPEIGRLREELSPHLRSWVVGNYVIFYRPQPNGIEVIRVLHGRRNFPALFNE